MIARQHEAEKIPSPPVPSPVKKSADSENKRPKMTLIAALRQAVVQAWTAGNVPPAAAEPKMPAEAGQPDVPAKPQRPAWVNAATGLARRLLHDKRVGGALHDALGMRAEAAQCAARGRDRVCRIIVRPRGGGRALAGRCLETARSRALVRAPADGNRRRQPGDALVARPDRFRCRRTAADQVGGPADSDRPAGESAGPWSSAEC